MAIVSNSPLLLTASPGVNINSEAEQEKGSISHYTDELQS
jgi:hypothetical protein